MSNELIMPFLEQDEKFVHGFECGQIWEWMQAKRIFKDYLIHQINEQQIEMMCENFGYEYNFERTAETWTIFNATPSGWNTN